MGHLIIEQILSADGLLHDAYGGMDQVRAGELLAPSLPVMAVDL
ncbi:hypothetical protein [Paenibacillus motobuensis]|uniref:Uncharacterized protein n=1 Tax=Paenibacillus motobuensis TaxID=295324 RepID=A0ABP3HTC5_9BACL